MSLHNIYIRKLLNLYMHTQRFDDFNSYFDKINDYLIINLD